MPPPPQLASHQRFKVDIKRNDSDTVRVLVNDLLYLIRRYVDREGVPNPLMSQDTSGKSESINMYRALKSPRPWPRKETLCNPQIPVM